MATFATPPASPSLCSPDKQARVEDIEDEDAANSQRKSSQSLQSQQMDGDEVKRSETLTTAEVQKEAEASSQTAEESGLAENEAEGDEDMAEKEEKEASASTQTTEQDLTDSNSKKRKDHPSTPEADAPSPRLDQGTETERGGNKEAPLAKAPKLAAEVEAPTDAHDTATEVANGKSGTADTESSCPIVTNSIVPKDADLEHSSTQPVEPVADKQTALLTVLKENGILLNGKTPNKLEGLET